MQSKLISIFCILRIRLIIYLFLTYFQNVTKQKQTNTKQSKTKQKQNVHFVIRILHITSTTTSCDILSFRRNKYVECACDLIKLGIYHKRFWECLPSLHNVITSNIMFENTTDNGWWVEWIWINEGFVAPGSGSKIAPPFTHILTHKDSKCSKTYIMEMSCFYKIYHNFGFGYANGWSYIFYTCHDFATYWKWCPVQVPPLRPTYATAINLSLNSDNEGACNRWNKGVSFKLLPLATFVLTFLIMKKPGYLPNSDISN